MSDDSSAHKDRTLAERVADIPGLELRLDDDSGFAELEFSIPDLVTALRVEWPTIATLGAPALALVIYSIYRVAVGEADAAALGTVLIFAAPVLLILGFIVVYWRQRSSRTVRLGEGSIQPEPLVATPDSPLTFTAENIIHLECVRRTDTITHLTQGYIVVESAFHRATFGDHLRDEELRLLWDFIEEWTTLPHLRLPLAKMISVSLLAGCACAAATFATVDSVLRVGEHPQLVHGFAGLTVGVLVFGLVLGGWRRSRRTLEG